MIHIELKKAIINCIIENLDQFQLTNLVTKTFREYIFNSKGCCLIGGEEVLEFIEKAIILIKK